MYDLLLYSCNSSNNTRYTIFMLSERVRWDDAPVPRLYQHCCFNFGRKLTVAFAWARGWEWNDTVYTLLLALSALLTVYVVSSGYIKCCQMISPASLAPPHHCPALPLAETRWNLIYKGDFFEKQFRFGQSDWMRHKNTITFVIRVEDFRVF